MNEMAAWIARDNGGTLLIHDKAPQFAPRDGMWFSTGRSWCIAHELFPEVLSDQCKKAKIVLEEI